MKIAMVGAGYVGLVSGACLADFGHDVVCVDKDQGKIDALLAGIMPIFEPGALPNWWGRTSNPAACPSPPNFPRQWTVRVPSSLRWARLHGAAMAMPI